MQKLWRKGSDTLFRQREGSSKVSEGGRMLMRRVIFALNQLGRMQMVNYSTHASKFPKKKVIWHVFISGTDRN